MYCVGYISAEQQQYWCAGVSVGSLGGPGAEEFLVRFEGPGESPSGGIESEGDSLHVLIGHVECIAKIHEEGVALPLETVLI